MSTFLTVAMVLAASNVSLGCDKHPGVEHSMWAAWISKVNAEDAAKKAAQQANADSAGGVGAAEKSSVRAARSGESQVRSIGRASGGADRDRSYRRR